MKELNQVKRLSNIRIAAAPEDHCSVAIHRKRSHPLWGDEALRPITAEAVAAALWLSLYGFEDLPGGLMDGAYQRPCLIAELHSFDRIYAVRPLARGWRGKGPASWFDVQDWQSEMWFSAGYAAEVADMRRIKRLIEKGALSDTRYRKIELIEIATDSPAGYFAISPSGLRSSTPPTPSRMKSCWRISHECKPVRRDPATAAELRYARLSQSLRVTRPRSNDVRLIVHGTPLVRKSSACEVSQSTVMRRTIEVGPDPLIALVQDRCQRDLWYSSGTIHSVKEGIWRNTRAVMASHWISRSPPQANDQHSS